MIATEESLTFAASNATSLSTEHGKVYKHFNCMKSPDVPPLPSGATPPLALWSSFQCGLGLQPPSNASCRPWLRSQQGRKRLTSTLLLCHTAQVALPLNCPWNPCANAHQPSDGLADSHESGFNNQSQDELRFHHTFPNREELCIHAAMMTVQR